MGNSLFEEQQQNDLQSQFNRFTQNPLQFLASNNVKIPQQLANDPRGAVQNLLNSGKMSQGQLNYCMQTAQKMGFKFN